MRFLDRHYCCFGLLLLVMQTGFLSANARSQVDILYITNDVRECLLASKSTYEQPYGANTDPTGSPSTLSLSTLNKHTRHSYFPDRQLWMGSSKMRNIDVYITTRDSNYWGNWNTQTSVLLILDELNVIVQSLRSNGKNDSAYRTHAIVGPLFSSEAKAISQVTNIFNVVTISGSATSPDLASRSKYPLFFRTVPSDAAGPPVIMQTLLTMGYTEVNGLYFQDSSVQDFQTLFDKTVAGDSRFQQGPEYILYDNGDGLHPNPIQYYTNAAQGVKTGYLTGTPNTNNLGQTFVWMAVVASDDLNMYQMFCALAKAGVSGAKNQGFLFGSSPLLNAPWWSKPGNVITDTLYNGACSTAQIQNMLLGTIQVVQANYDINDAVADYVGITGSQFYAGMLAEFQRTGKGNELYGNIAYQFDSITAAALALDYAFGKMGPLFTFKYTDDDAKQFLGHVKEYLGNMAKFQGLTGIIQFDPNTGNQLWQYFEARQFQASTWNAPYDTVRIGTITVNNGSYRYATDKPAVYPTSDGKPPPQSIPQSYALAIAAGIVGGLMFLLAIPSAIWLIRKHMNKIALEAALKNAENWFVDSHELELELGKSLSGSMLTKSLGLIHK